MFRKMRRWKQELPREECLQILTRETCGVLCLMDEAYPYSVPLSYVYADNTIYFHSAKVGHKIDLIKKNPLASFCIVEKNEIVPAEYTTYFRSVIAFGDVRILTTQKEMKEVMMQLGTKFNPEDSASNREQVICKAMDLLSVLAFDIKHLSGKEAIELV